MNLTPKDVKKSLRNDFLASRRDLSPLTLHQASKEVCARILDYVYQQDVLLIYAFYPMALELDLLPLFESLPSQASIALPVIEGRGKMQFFQWQRGDNLIKNRFGTLEPPIDKRQVAIEAVTRALMLVPALAVDQEGFRLGFGGGYYDRYLEKRPSLKTMVPILERWLVPSLPREGFDQPVEMAVTEKRIMQFKN